MPERSAATGAPPPDFGAATGAPTTAMAALPPPAPEASPFPPPVLPSTPPCPSLLGCVDSTAPRAGDGQQPATGSSGQEFVGGMGRVGGQGSEATDGDGGLKMGSSGQEFVGGMGRVGGQGSAATDDGGKGTQCKNTKQNQRKKLNGSSLIKIFYTATETLSGSKYPTSHLYFFQLWNIKKVLNTEESVLNRKILNEEASSQDTTIAHMVEQMQTKFNLYWKEIYMSACIPVILDPRYKYDFLEYHLSDFGSEKEVDTWMSEVKNTTQKLFNEYNQLISGEMQDCDIQEVQDLNDPLAEWDQYMKSKRRQLSNELDQYLKEKLTPRREEIDILKWWKGKSEIYPVLSVMARDILAIPASTVPSESAFSTGGRVVSDYRSSLAPTTIEALICLQDWFKAADAMENDD